MRAGFVYFIKPVGLDGPIKIGFSNNPELRLDTLAAWSPWPLEIVGQVPGNGADETFLHECFKNLHSHREWFRSSPQLRLIIDEMLAAGSMSPARSKLTPQGSIRRGRAGRSESFRKYQSYASRIRHREWTMSEHLPTEIVSRRAPDDIHTILNRWLGNSYRGIPGVPPSPAEIERLDDFIARPRELCVETRTPRLNLVPKDAA